MDAQLNVAFQDDHEKAAAKLTLILIEVGGTAPYSLGQLGQAGLKSTLIIVLLEEAQSYR